MINDASSRGGPTMVTPSERGKVMQFADIGAQMVLQQRHVL
jgi:hypothetical protein